MSDKYQVIIAENEEVLFDCTEGDTSGGVSFFADSLEEAERILDEHTAIPGKGGVIIPPDGGETSVMVSPMRTRDDIDAAAYELDFRISNFHNRHADFELGMINGKRSALNWVLSNEWDSELLPPSVYHPPENSNESSTLVAPMRTRDAIGEAETQSFMTKFGMTGTRA